MSNWRKYKNVWCSWPSNPIGIIEYIGGSYLAVSPHICYKCLLESLVSKNFAIHAWNFIPTFDHQSQANEAWRDLRFCKSKLEQRVNSNLKSIRIGHSLGCKLHLLSPDKGRNSCSMIAISFNNFKASNSIPLLNKFASKLNFETEFSPSPQETLRYILNHYQQSKNLIINFSNDKIDQSRYLLDCLKKRDIDSSLQITLTGDHLTPVSSGLRKNLLGEWSKNINKLKNIETLTEKIFDYSEKTLGS